MGIKRAEARETRPRERWKRTRRSCNAEGVAARGWSEQRDGRRSLSLSKGGGRLAQIRFIVIKPLIKLLIQRVKLADSFLEKINVEVRVKLGSRDGNVAEQLLNDPQIRARLDQMRRKRVAEGVRRNEIGRAHV